MALADPMVGSPADRAERICTDIARFRTEALVVSRIPGGQATARLEAAVIGEIIRAERASRCWKSRCRRFPIRVDPSLRTRLEALVETAMEEEADDLRRN